MRAYFYGIGIALSLVLFTSRSGYSTTFAPQPFPEEVENAPVIVRGKIGMHYSDWGHDAAGTKKIYTLYELQVSETFKGQTQGPSITIREMGGEKDGVGMNVAGTSQYDRGEDVVVFLQEQNAEGSYDVQGMMMGKLNIETDAQGKEYLVGPALIGENPGQNDTTVGKKWSLEALRDLIQNQRSQIHPTVSKDEKVKAAQIPTQLSATPLPPPKATVSPASQLQTQESEDPNPTRNNWLGWLIGGLGVLALIALLRLARWGKT